MNGWGLGFFRVNPEGHVTVHPDANKKRGLDLYNLAMDLHAQGVGLPLLLRFSDILHNRIESLTECFEQAIRESDGSAHVTVIERAASDAVGTADLHITGGGVSSLY
jgi:arginine decarboxylase